MVTKIFPENSCGVIDFVCYIPALAKERKLPVKGQRAYFRSSEKLNLFELDL